MSPTVSPPDDSAAASLEEPPPRAASGAGGWTTVVVLPVSTAPVASSTAPTTATTIPPSTPASRFDRPFTTAEGRRGRLIRSKTRVRRDGEEAGEASQWPAAVGQRAAQGASVARCRRPARSGSRVALLAQQTHVPRGVRSGRELQPALQVGERRAGRVVVAEPVERTAQLRHRALSPPRVEMRPAPADRHEQEDGERERHEHEERCAEEPPVGCRPPAVRT